MCFSTFSYFFFNLLREEIRHIRYVSYKECVYSHDFAPYVFPYPFFPSRMPDVFIAVKGNGFTVLQDWKKSIVSDPSSIHLLFRQNVLYFLKLLSSKVSIHPFSTFNVSIYPQDILFFPLRLVYALSHPDSLYLFRILFT